MNEEDRVWVETGHRVQVTGNQLDRVPEYDARSGAHLWTWAVLFRAVPGVESPMLDGENLLMVTGPGCYYCERVYTPLRAARRCPGEPK